MTRIGIIDHMINHGGGSRVLKNLLPAIKRLRPDWTIVLYGNQEGIKREGFDLFFENQIEIVPLKSVKLMNLRFVNKLRGGRIIIAFLQKKLRKLLSILPYYLSGAVDKEIEKISKECDLLLCTWPYLLTCPKINSNLPFFTIFHDFNFRYNFNGQIWHPIELDYARQEIPKWIEATNPIVTTNFMKNELNKFYPGKEKETTVIHLSSLTADTKQNQEGAAEIVRSLGIFNPYILYPTNTSAHKNVSGLLRAFFILKQKYPNYKLVFAGNNTGNLSGKVGPHSLEMGQVDPDVIGLGYVSNFQIDALIQCAAAVISTSFYEAGCGPGLDGWQLGVPVAMSNIPPFLEHSEVLGVEAQVFDPSSPKDIADKIDWILSHPELAQKSAKHSQERMNAYQWDQVAQKFIDAFNRKLHV